MDTLVILAMILGWIICGIIGGVIAHNKGRSAEAWGVVSFLLGPLGIVLALVTSRDEIVLEAHALESGTSRKCPQCAEIVKAEATKCRYCGSTLEPLPEPSMEPLPEPSIAGTCPICSFALQKPVPLCPQCGTKDPLRRSRMMKRMTLLVLFLAGSLFVCLPAYGQSTKNYGSLGRFYVPKSYSSPQSYTPRTYKYESRNWSVGGYSKHTYKYKSGGRTYKGTMETFPSGAVRHKGRWR